MNNIEFIKIEIQNFKSVGDLITINYKELNGLNFIYGKNIDMPSARNGSGKTAVFVDSIVFALFGKTLKNTNNKYIPNRNITEKLKPYVKLYLRSNGQLYSCETSGRVVSNTMSTITMELLKLNDDYSIDEDLTQSSVNKTKQYIQENILGCTFNIFKSSIVVSYADFMNFYEGMNKDQKRKYVESIFNLDCFGDMFSLIKSDINDNKKEITSSKNEILKNADLANELTKKFNNFDEELKNKRSSLKERIQKRINDLKKLEETNSLLIVNDEDDIQNKKDSIKNEINDLISNKNKLDKQKLKLELEITHINDSINEMMTISNGLCNDCKKIMNDRYDYDIKKETIENSKKLIDKIIIKLNEFDELINKKTNELNSINIEIKKNNEIKNKKLSINSDISIVKNELKNLKLSFEEVKEGTENPFKTLLESSKKSLNDIKDRLITYTKNLKHLEILKEACSENGVKKYIIKDIVKLLNSLIQKYLNEIGAEFLVYFDETFDFKFVTCSGECEFSNFSAGERQRIQIATILAFRDIILNSKISSNILIIDELLDANIDTICIENVMSILKKKSIENKQNIFIISHRSELADNESIWDNIIKVTKESGKSLVEVK